MKFCIHIDIDNMYPWDCQMIFEIGWVFAEVQILKNVSLLQTEFIIVEILPSSKFWKSENGHISWTEWNIVMKFCIHIGIDTM